MVIRKKALPRLTLQDLEGISKYRLGFTGKSTELTAWDQTRILACLLALARRWPHAVWITGGCVGADAFVAMVGHAAGFHVHTVLPAYMDKVDPDWEDHCSSYTQMKTDPNLSRSANYMLRNDELVRRSTHMGAAFPEGPEEQRSGTWSTIRRFRKAGMPTKRIIILN